MSVINENLNISQYANIDNNQYISTLMFIIVALISFKNRNILMKH